jgi:UDP-GlcNAc3NAcA epimerase
MIKKILTVVGARPQIIKSAAVSRVMRQSYGSALVEVVVHTGQHYDAMMSDVFFDELEIPKPAYNLAIGSSSHASQTAAMLIALEEVFLRENPNAVLVYGDTNSTLAAALVASKMHIPIVHVEAGLRSFNKKMPEEINRIMTDHLSSVLFAPTIQAIDNLRREGFQIQHTGPIHPDNPFIAHCGDVMLDNALHFKAISKTKSNVLTLLGLVDTPFFLATIHRDANTDNTDKLSQIFSALLRISVESNTKCVIPLHPRTKKMLERAELAELNVTLKSHASILLIDPVSYLDMIALESSCEMIFTDSGGVQKESYFFEKPCVILRPQTEWVELVENGNAVIADSDEQRIIDAFEFLSKKQSFSWPPFYGDGNAAVFICDQLLQLN